MHCDGCVNLIKDVTMEIPGMSEIDIDLDSKTVTLHHSEEFDFEDWKAAIEDLDEVYAIIA